MRLVLFAAVSGLCLGLGAAACAPHADYAARTRLDCPAAEGGLTRTAIAADGRSCTYRGGQDVDVTLRLVPVTGDPAAALSPIEASLTGATAASATPAAPPKAPAPAFPDAASKAAREADEDAVKAEAGPGDGGRKHTVIIDTDSKHVSVDGHDHAAINPPGLHINADGDTAKIDVGGMHVDTANGDTTVRVMHESRLRGEAFSPHRNGVRAAFIANRGDLPDGEKMVGYIASGPKTGPLTVGLIRARRNMDDSSKLYQDVRRLVRANGGA